MSKVSHTSTALVIAFAKGARPGARDIARLLASHAEAAASFAISHQDADEASWVELLANGLTFDLLGLAPHESMPAPAVEHFYGFPSGYKLPEVDSLALVPGAHLAGGESLLAVVRAQMQIAAQLATLPGVVAMVWQPARCAMESAYFRQLVGRWSQGAAFPALGLTAITRAQDGAITSYGLSFFTGQELRIEPISTPTPAAAGKIAIRLIHSLVEGGPAHEPFQIMGPEGERLLVEPSADGRLLSVWPQT